MNGEGVVRVGVRWVRVVWWGRGMRECGEMLGRWVDIGGDGKDGVGWWGLDRLVCVWGGEGGIGCGVDGREVNGGWGLCICGGLDGEGEGGGDGDVFCGFRGVRGL